MNSRIAISLERADDVLAELLTEYDNSLHTQDVSVRAAHLTHEVCERLRSVLDRSARSYWDKHIAAALLPEDRQAATVYFPIASDRNGLDSILGRWRWKTVRTAHQPLYDFLLKFQPFTNPTNHWLVILNDLAVQGKHIDLVPQRRIEEQRIIISSGRASVSRRRGAKFGHGGRVLGARIGPSTQPTAPRPGVMEKLETWVSFMIQGHDVSAARFCREACRNTRSIVLQMCDNFGL